MRKISLLGALCAGSILLYGSMSNAALVAYTNYASFISNLPGPSTTLDFDGLALPTTINSGDTIGGITFTYDFSGTSMVVTDGNQYGGGGPFDTTSGSKLLGTDDSDIFLDDDDFTMDFGPVSAIGMYFITAEVPGLSIYNGDIQLTVGTISASLDINAVQQTLADGSLVFFLGLIDDSGTFTTASISTPNSNGSFLYNIDDITVSAIPLPGALWLFGFGLVGLIVIRRRR